MNEDRKLVTKKDTVILLILLVALCALLLFVHFGADGAKAAVISVDGEEYTRVSLDEDGEITLNNGVRIIVSDSKIGFADSDCPDKICVRTGMLSRSGDVAVCVPNKTVITVAGSDKTVDTVTY